MTNWDNYSAIDQITKCQFECEGGPLENNVAWRWLKERINDGLPETLEEWIKHDQLQRIKIKLQGENLAWDIERTLAAERADALRIGQPMGVDCSPDKAQPHRVQPVQHGRRPLRVPPIRRQLAKMRRFFRPDRCRRGCIAHPPSLTGRAPRGEGSCGKESCGKVRHAWPGS